MVLDQSGATVAGAQISLKDTDGAELRTVTTGGNGEFIFTKLPVGSYFIVVNSGGFEPFKSTRLIVTARETVTMHPILA